LSRDLADAGHYPAIDIEASVSRAITQIVTDEHLANVREFKRIYSIYQRNRDLINIGAYERGSDADIDLAIALKPDMDRFLQQAISERRSLQQSINELDAVLQNAADGSSYPGLR
jgi:flagellum-specific ATP synthase